MEKNKSEGAQKGEEIAKNRKFCRGIAFFLTFLLIAAALSVNAAAAEKLIPSGDSFGVKIRTEGAVVDGISGVETEAGTVTPADAAGILPGDVIVELDKKPVNTAKEVRDAAESSKGNPISVKFIRGNTENFTVITPAYSVPDAEYRTGLWLRDSAAGIGTLTYVSADRKRFGGLGHGICCDKTGRELPLLRGTVTNVNLTGIKKGKYREPGELKGTLSANRTGEIKENSKSGVFGKFDSEYPTGQKPLPVAADSEVKTGKAEILTTVDKDGRGKYEIEIVSIEKESDTKNLLLKVTDKRLIDKTGGIVQGMSGSPIIQNGKLVGAVTHVTLNDPTKGYGIFISRMIREA